MGPTATGTFLRFGTIIYIPHWDSTTYIATDSDILRRCAL